MIKFMKLRKLGLLFLIMIFCFEVNVVAFEVSVNGSCQIDGVEYPGVGFGTYPLQDEICEQAVMDAANLGYRIIDTATFYENFIPIGKVLNLMGRQKFYVISKVWPDAQTPTLMVEDLKRTLNQLETTYLDAYLLHWPNSTIPIEDTLQTMEELRSAGLVRHIGLSNVNINHLKRALEVGIPISWVQIELHPLFCDFTLLKYCQENEITVQAWAPLGRGRISDDIFLVNLGIKYGKSASQVAIKWILQHGCIPLPGSKNKKHMQKNLEVNDFTISAADMKEIDERAGIGKRERITEDIGLGFTDEFDFSYEACWPKQ
ncbi:MAG: aldo/keto reductase [Parachlamydiaceae bacterium]|nr:aldo/keto reductase [Parachlamydiaceae bacterium]